MRRRNRGVALTEFVIVGPLVLFLGLVGIQYGLVYNAKLNVSYAAYEAARAGAMYNADPARIQDAFYKGLIPFFATSGINLPGNIHIPSPFKAMRPSPSIPEVAVAGITLKALIQRSESAFVGIHMINPSIASFSDWHSTDLERMYKIKTGLDLGNRRMIPNDNLDQMPMTIGKLSQQSIQDANVLKLRITYGYEPRIPLMGKLFSSVLSFLNSDRDSVSARILAANRIPITVDVSAQMLSPPIEAGIPTTTVNRSGYLVGPELANAIIGGQSMQWQVGQSQQGFLNTITNTVEQQAINAATQAINNGNITQIGSSVGNAISSYATSLIRTSSPTGAASNSTTSLVGDMNNLVSCSSDSYATNFF